MPQPRRSEAWSGLGIGWAITATMVGGIAAWGLIGYLVDRLLGTTRLFTAVGVVLGAGGAIYVVYLRFGKRERDGGGA
jgi:F0F1-type ATP synthase assembly protein I